MNVMLAAVVYPQVSPRQHEKMLPGAQDQVQASQGEGYFFFTPTPSSIAALVLVPTVLHNQTCVQDNECGDKFYKDCFIDYRPVTTARKVKLCHEGISRDCGGHGDGDRSGEVVCSTQYQSGMSNRMRKEHSGN